MSYAIVGGCVAPVQLAPFLHTLQNESGCAYASIYRGEDPAAVVLLHRLGKHDQAEIYSEYLRGIEPNPANPPGHSTHELRSDGVAYPSVASGFSLAWWQCGIDVDVDHIPAIIDAAARHGWELFRPYPTGAEYHHVNFRRQPGNPAIDLRVGDSGRLVAILSARLRILGYMPKKASVFGPHVHHAVVRFQRSHHLAHDGVVGPKTWATLKRSAESAERRRGAR